MLTAGNIEQTATPEAGSFGWKMAVASGWARHSDTSAVVTAASPQSVVGEDDPWRPNVELLHQRMVTRGISHRFEVLPGEHAAEYWIDNVDHYLAFYSAALATSANLIAIDSDGS